MGDVRQHGVRLPPGQRVIEGFPRFGTHLYRPPPPVPPDHVIEVAGAGAEVIRVSRAALARLPRRELTAEFHCVAGWSAVGLRWEGVAFATFFREIVEPALDDASTISHVVVTGLDGYSSTLLLEDACRDDVLIAENLDGLPLDADHGAPVRLVSPSQYGHVSIKHLSRIDVRTSRPTRGRRSPADVLIESHPRARVWREERHARVPGRSIRTAYRLLIPPIRYLSEAGSASGPSTARAADRHPGREDRTRTSARRHASR